MIHLFKRFIVQQLDQEPFTPNEKFRRPDNPVELTINNYSLSIGGQKILDNINLRLPSNKITCIIGPSGCGKSTLLRSMNRLTDTIEDVHIEGNICLGDKNITQASDAELVELRRRIGLVPQRPTPLPMSILHNVIYGCKIHGLSNSRQLRKIGRHYLKVVGLLDEVKTRLKESASKLSIGQQQRLCLARSLAVEPEYILADEATSALDPQSSNTIEELFTKLKSDYSIVMVTHTLSQARRIADYVVFIYLGRIIEMGDAKQVFENPQNELTKKYLGGQIS